MRSQRERLYYAYNRTQESFLATEVKLADGYFTRLIGLLGKTKRWAYEGRGLWIVPSKGVHTLGMLFPIDVVFLDKNNIVVHVEEHLRPFRISTVSLRAASVLELPVHTIFRSGTKAGDQFEIKPLPKPEDVELAGFNRAGGDERVRDPHPQSKSAFRALVWRVIQRDAMPGR